MVVRAGRLEKEFAAPLLDAEIINVPAVEHLDTSTGTDTDI
jgi:hypothetical protein